MAAVSRVQHLLEGDSVRHENALHRSSGRVTFFSLLKYTCLLLCGILFRLEEHVAYEASLASVDTTQVKELAEVHLTHFTLAAHANVVVHDDLLYILVASEVHLSAGILVGLHFRHDGLLVFVRKQVCVASHLHGHHECRVHVLQLLWISKLEAELALILRDYLECCDVGARVVRYTVKNEQKLEQSQNNL